MMLNSILGALALAPITVTAAPSLKERTPACTVSLLVKGFNDLPDTDLTRGNLEYKTNGTEPADVYCEFWKENVLPFDKYICQNGKAQIDWPQDDVDNFQEKLMESVMSWSAKTGCAAD